MIGARYRDVIGALVGAGVVTLAASGLVGCGGSPVRAVAPGGGRDPTPLARCSVAASHDEPLVTEWPASSKARLEALLQRGGVAVSYSGCEMRIIEACSVTGAYAWRRTTLATDSVEIRDEDELFAKLPLGALALSGALQRSGMLLVRTTVAGQMQFVRSNPAETENDPGCAKATHVVTGFSVGAFKLVAGAQAAAKAGAGAGFVGGGLGSSEVSSSLREAGDPSKCGEATDERPSSACRSPIQVFLQPLAHAPPARGVEAVPIGPPPPDMAHAAEKPPSKAAAITTGGLALATVGVGAYFLLDASASQSSIQSGGFSSGADIDARAQSAATSRTMGFVFVGGGAVLTAVAIPLLVSAFGHSDPKSNATTAGAR